MYPVYGRATNPINLICHKLLHYNPFNQYKNKAPQYSKLPTNNPIYTFL